MTADDVTGRFDPPTIPRRPVAEVFPVRVNWPPPADEPDVEADETWAQGVL